MIRLANKFDMPFLIEMMRSFSLEVAIQIFNKEYEDDKVYIENLLTSLIVGRGFILVDDELHGMLAAIKTKNTWKPNIWELRELIWWVNPDKRNSSLAGRLWKTFDDKANEMKEKKEIDIVCCSLQTTSPSIDYVKRGYKLAEYIYYKD